MSSQYVPDRWSSYNSKCLGIATNLKLYQEYLDTAKFDYSEDFLKVINEPFNLEFMNEDGTTYFEKHTMQFSMSLYSSRLVDFSNMNMTQNQGKLDIISFGITPPGYIPKFEERIEYFLDINGLNVLGHKV